MQSDARGNQDIIQYIKQLAAKTNPPEASMPADRTTEDAPRPTERRRQVSTEHAANPAPSSATAHNLGGAIDSAIHASVLNWFAAHPNVVDDAVYQKVESMVHQLIQEEVRAWINKRLPQYVKTAVRELISTIKNPSVGEGL